MFSYHRADPSCAFGAALLQGPTGLWLSHIGFHTATRTHPALMAWLPSKGLRDLEWLILVFILLRVKLQTLN